MEKSVKRIMLGELLSKYNAGEGNIRRLKEFMLIPREKSGISLEERKAMSDKIVELRKWALVWSSIIQLYEEIK